MYTVDTKIFTITKYTQILLSLQKYKSYFTLKSQTINTMIMLINIWVYRKFCQRIVTKFFQYDARNKYV